MFANGAFNSSLVEQFICCDVVHKRNTRAKTKNHKQRINYLCPAPTEHVWYGQGQKPVVPVLCIPDVSGILPDVSGITWTRTLIVLQLSI